MRYLAAWFIFLLASACFGQLDRIVLSPASNEAGGGTTKLTVYLTAAAAAPTVVQLTPSDSTLAVPATVTIPAGKSAKSIIVNVNAVTEDSDSTLVAGLGSDRREAAFTAYLSPASLSLPAPTVIAGVRCFRVAFTPFYSSPKLKYSIRYKKTSDTTYTTLKSGAGIAYIRTATAAATSHDIFVEATFPSGRIVDSPVVTASTLATGPTLSFSTAPSNPLTGNWTTTVTTSAGTLTDAEVVDAATAVTSTHGVTLNPSTTLSLTTDSTILADGNHSLKLFGMVGGIPATNSTNIASVTVGNGFSALAVDDFADDQKSDLAIIEATLKDATSTWSVDILDSGNIVVNSASGSGATVRWHWPGAYTSGTAVPYGDYTMRLTTTGTAGTRVTNRAISVIAKNPNFLGFVYRFGSGTGDLQYARDLLYELGRMNYFYPGSIRPAVFVKSGAATTTPEFKNRIRKWLKNTAIYFYIDAHGFGKFYTSQNIHEVYWADMVFGNYTPAIPDETYIDVRKEVGTRPYKFVWVDACQSAGAGNYSPAEMTTNPNLAWAAAFNVYPSYGACYVGWNGNAMQMFDPNTGASNVWYRWSRKFWQYCADGYSIWDAQFQSFLDATPPYSSFNPWDTLTVGGNIYGKRHQYGDTYLP